MIEELRMAEMLCTRLCHDLTGPIGAVNNGAEFLSEEGFNLQNQAVDFRPCRDCSFTALLTGA
jgi:histidine phosphotransferase ChpT